MSSADAPEVPDTRADEPAGRSMPLSCVAADSLLRAAAAHDSLRDPPARMLNRTLMRIHLASRESADSGVNLALT